VDVHKPEQFASIGVLVVEDHDFQRSIAVRILKQLGVVNIVEAADGHSGLAHLRSVRFLVHVVLCDLGMAGMDGIEFIRHLATTYPKAALIVLSGLEHAILGSAETMARGYGLRVLGSIEKPITAQKLLNLLNRLSSMSTGNFHARARVFTKEELAAGLAAKQFTAYFQPMVRINDLSVRGAEALARWNHPELGVVNAGEFILSAEQHGLSDDISWNCMECACENIKKWSALGIHIAVSVNLNMRFLENIGVANRIADLARSSSVSPELLTIEVTESLATTQFVNVLENLARLRIQGFGISIDDYGTGYSSMQQLSRIPFTELKLDGSFVTGSVDKPSQRAILESALELSQKLNLQTIAEGVERQEDWNLLRALHCDIAQGYFISKALPADEFVIWYRDWVAGIPK
jgi:EAL domain-containing protein (putative c-di-GMP-specific phosphodiesterase class I)/ActR/RegA family two-component response regulator